MISKKGDSCVACVERNQKHPHITGMVAHMDRSVGAQDKEPNNMGNIENQLVAHSKEVRGRGNQMPEGRNVQIACSTFSVQTYLREKSQAKREIYGVFGFLSIGIYIPGQTSSRTHHSPVLRDCSWWKKWCLDSPAGMVI